MSCLFNSLGHLLGELTDAVRQRICDNLAANIAIIEGMDTAELLRMEHPNYIEHMRSPATWGGAIEIQAACSIWNVKIEVENRRSAAPAPDIEFVPVGSTTPPTRTLRIYWTGGHYEPVSIA
jgi:hypothetical protein